MAMWAAQQAMENVEHDMRARLKREGKSDSEIEFEVNEMWKKNLIDTATGAARALMFKFF